MTRIVVDPGRPIGRLDRNVFGGFVEHLGRCVYGGIYDEGNPLADARGFRLDVLTLLRDLHLGVLRWPGGNFASNYHWADGIGPKDARPRRPNLAWGGEESNRFGTDEFLAYCAELGEKSDYVLINHARWDHSLPVFMARQLPKKTFRSYLLANLAAHHLAAMPVLYRLA